MRPYYANVATHAATLACNPDSHEFRRSMKSRSNAG